MGMSSFSNEHQRLIRSTKLLPFGFKLLEGKDETCTLFGRNSTCNILQNCNKTALLLPDVDAHLKYLETVKGNENKVFLSKNGSVTIRFGFQFFDWVHPRVLKRLAGLQESYIMEWWTKFVVDFVPKIKTVNLETELAFKSTSIHGKIFTIFVLWTGGFTICILTYLAEKFGVELVRYMYKHLIRFQKQTVKTFKIVVVSMLKRISKRTSS